MKLNLDLEVRTRGEEEIQRLDAKLRKLEARAKAVAESFRKATTVAQSSGRGKVPDAVKSIRAEQAEQRRAFQSLMSFKVRMAKQAEAEARRQSQGDDRAFRMRMAFNDRLFRQREKEQRQAERAETAARARQDRGTERSFRRSLSFNTRMAAQRAAEDRAADRERDKADRQRIRLENYRAALRLKEDRRVEREEAGNRRDAVRHGRSTVQHSTDAYHRIARPIATGGAIAAGAGALAARTGISARMAVDTAETNLQIFSGLTADQIKAARRGWLDKEAIKNGLGIAGGLEAYNETLKAGIKAPEEVTRTIMGAVTALELDLKETTRLTGLIDRNFGAASTPAKLKSALNAVAITAKEDPTQANEIVEGTKRAFGVLSMSKISPEHLVAMVSGGQSVGIQPGKAGTFLGALFQSVSEADSKFLDPKKRKEMGFVALSLGFGSAKNMAVAMRADGAAFYLDLMKKLNGLEAGQRTQVAQALGGHQWADEIVQQSGGVAGLESTMKSVDDPANANFLDEAAKKRQESWLGQWKSTKAIIDKFWESFGAGFDEILTAVNSFFLDASGKFNFDSITDVVKQGLEGVKEALGVKTWRDLFQGAFGGDLAGVGRQVREFARGFTEGILSVARAIRSILTVFTGTNASLESMGKFTAEIIALSAALVVAAPAITVLAGLASVVGTLATAALGAWSILKAAGVVGATVPKVPGASVGAGAAGGLLGRLFGRFGLGAAATVGPSTSLSKAEQDRLHDKLGAWAQERERQAQGNKPAGTWVDPPLRKSLDELKESLDRNSLIQKQSADETWRGLIHRTSISGTAGTLRNDLAGIGSSFRPALDGSINNFSGGPLSQSQGGSFIGNGGGLSRRGIFGGGGGSNPGGAEASSAPGRGAANHMSGQYGPAGSNLTTITTASGKRVTVHRAAAENFRGFLNELEGSGYKINSLGGHNHRTIRGGSRLSQHAYGNAIDINPAQNPMGSRLVTDMPKNVSDMAAKWGLTWGGDWKRRPDAMHFEWNGRTLEQLRSGNAGTSQTPTNGATGGLTDVINRAAAEARIDPRILQGIRAGESGHRADYDKNITAREESYGPFQLNRKGGLGAVFEKQTGLDLKDPRTIQAQAQWVARHIAEKFRRNPNYNPGSEWYGYKGLRNADPRWGDSGLVESIKRDQQRAQDIGDGFRSSGWKPAPAGAGLGAKTPLGQDAPIRPPNTQPIGGAGAGGGGSSTSSISAPITINGAGQDAESIANAVQRKIQESMNRRTHDMSPTVA